MFAKIKIAVVAVFVIVVGCGSSGDLFDATIPSQVNPIVTRIDPTSANAGDTVTIFGIGFSAVPELNVIVMGSATTSANNYSLLPSPSGDEVESLTFVVPSGITPGTYPIYVVVVDNVSNTNVTITINP